MLIETAFLCLALNVFHEARGEMVPGQYAVAFVTMNRAGGHDRVCHETFRPKQFSWTGGVVKTTAGWKIPKHLHPRLDNPLEAHAWEKAQVIARVTLEGRMLDITRGADHYHATYVRPAWAGSMQRVRQIGTHIFYVKPTR